MSASQQYIDLYRTHADTICSHSSGIMNSRRAGALDLLMSTPLPRRGDEGYARFSIDDAFAPDYGINLTRAPYEADDSLAFTCLIPKVSSLMATVINDSLRLSSNLRRSIPDGVTVCTLAEASERMPEIVEKFYGRIARQTPQVALNTLLAQEGLFIHVAKGVNLNRPLQITNLLATDTDFMAVRRVLVVMEENSAAEILVCDHTRNPEKKYLVSQVIEMHLAAGASLAWYDLEESSENTTRISSLYATQDSGSNLTVNNNTLTGGSTRNEFDIASEGDSTSTELSGMVIASGHQITDNSTLVTHSGRHSSSHQLFKYVVDDEASGAFEGLIRVMEGAEFTEALQTNRNLLASQGAKMHTQPQLLINCDEVKCSHGATTGQLDAAALFYMRQRGIPAEEARTILMQAFMSDVIETVKLEGLRDRLRYLVEKRFSGRRVLCAECPAHTTTDTVEGGDA